MHILRTLCLCKIITSTYLSVESRQTKYMQYLDQPTLPVPRSTEHYKKQKCDSNDGAMLINETDTYNLEHGMPAADRLFENTSNNYASTSFEIDRQSSPDSTESVDSMDHRQNEASVSHDSDSSDEDIHITSDSEVDQLSEGTDIHIPSDTSDSEVDQLSEEEQKEVTEEDQKRYVLLSFMSKHNLSASATDDLLSMMQLFSDDFS